MDKSGNSYYKCIQIIKDMFQSEINVKDQQSIKTFLSQYESQEEKYSKSIKQAMTIDKQCTEDLLNLMINSFGPIHVQTI